MRSAKGRNGATWHYVVISVAAWRFRSTGRGDDACFGGRNFAHEFGRTNAFERHGGIEMSFLLFLRGLIGMLLVFAITTYLVTHSLWTTFIQTVICAVLAQIGYFAAVLFLVWRSADTRKIEDSSAKNEAVQGSPTKDQPAGKVGRLTGGVPRSHQP
jgi:exopolysaccharide production repressor protein